MARAYSLPETSEPDLDAQSGEWQALRGELVALLDQVEGRYATQPQPADPQIEGLARRVRALRSQVSETPGTARRREALRSVKKAVDRFSERDDNGVAEPDELRAAIAEIRSRQTAAQAPIIARRGPEASQLAQLTGMVGGLSGRLEGLESELKGLRAGAGNVREVAAQVEQLSQVVELLAGAVGETGQVKRLEAQLASLAKIIQNAPQADLGTINKRLDELATTVGKLAELQVQQMEREIARDERKPAADPALRAIEDGVRNVYDRIDMIERNVGLSQGDLERVTGEMAAFTAAMGRKDAAPDNLLAKIDELAGQIGGFENRTGDVVGLRQDIAALRDAVIGGFEPRFVRLEKQIEALGEKGARPIGEAPSVTQIEAQLQKLMSRLDETGAKIDDLTKLQATGDGSFVASQPDMSALADIVAERTSQAVGKLVPASAPAVDTSSLDALEKRMSALINTTGRDTAERLTRLETTLSGRGKNDTPGTRAQAAGPGSSVSQLAGAEDARDLMPTDPSEDTPLVDRGFETAGPVRTALAAKNGPRKPSGDAGKPDAVATQAKGPEKSGKPAPASEPPAFDPASVQRPPQPMSSLAEPKIDPFGEPAAPARAPAPEPEVASAPLTSQSTFIAAARRAQRARQEATGTAPAANSLIGRALSRVMAPQDSGAAPAPAAERKAAAEEAAPTAPKRGKRRWGRSAATESVAIDAEPTSAVEETVESDGNEVREGFLTRNRRTILLAAALVAVSALALNLAMQRLTPARTPTAPQISTEGAETGDATGIESMLDTEPLESAATLTAPQMIDATATGSIDPNIALGFAKPLQQTTAMPPALAMDKPFTYAGLATENGPATTPETTSNILTGSVPAMVEGPVTFDPPAEGVGPEAMRQAAANGDPRAQFEVAAILTEGRAVEQDYAEAAIWYERAAAQGFAPAQYRLGNLYESGNGVDKDLEIARLWYQRAAEAGNRMAMHNLAAIHASGELGEQDFEIAAEWFEQAGERGMTDSQFNLGMLFARGLGVEQDFEQSYKWFALAARSGDADAAKGRDDITRSLTAEAVSRLNEELEDWTNTPIDLTANFAPIGTWADDFDPGQAISNRQVITKVQETLARLGYDVGAADGLAGPKTREAISSFERETGMSESGTVNPRLLAVLGSQPV